jgi:hypothetical protein
MRNGNQLSALAKTHSHKKSKILKRLQPTQSSKKKQHASQTHTHTRQLEITKKSVDGGQNQRNKRGREERFFNKKFTHTIKGEHDKTKSRQPGSSTDASNDTHPNP